MLSEAKSSLARVLREAESRQGRSDDVERWMFGGRGGEQRKDLLNLKEMTRPCITRHLSQMTVKQEA
jgi:hypothetical protein